MHRERQRRPDLEQFLQSSDTAGQREERVGSLVHDVLALTHGVDNEEFVGVDVGHLEWDQVGRDHPDSVGTSGARGGGDCPHHRDPPAAGYQ